LTLCGDGDDCRENILTKATSEDTLETSMEWRYKDKRVVFDADAKVFRVEAAPGLFPRDFAFNSWKEATDYVDSQTKSKLQKGLEAWSAVAKKMAEDYSINRDDLYKEGVLRAIAEAWGVGLD